MPQKVTGMRSAEQTPKRYSPAILTITVAAVFCIASSLYPNLLTAQPKSAESSITASVSVGLDPEIPSRRLDSWIGLNVLLENRGEPIEGELIAQICYGLEATDVFYSCPVDLPTGSRKMYRIPMFLFAEGVEIQTSIAQDGKQIPLERLAVPTVDDDVEMVAVLTRDRDTLNFLAGPRKTETDNEIRKMLYADIQTLPAKSICYQGLTTFIWYGKQSETRLTPEQMEAFRDWLTMGGRLTLFAGLQSQELLQTPWANFLPVKLGETRTLPAGTILEGPILNKPQALSSSTVISTGTLHEALNPRVLLRAGNIPLVTEVDWGAGTVVYCAFEPEPNLLESRETTFDLWDSLLSPVSNPAPSLALKLDNTVSYYLRSLLQAELPGVWFIAGFLGIYIILLVPVNYFIFRRFRRLELAWAMVPVWAIIFAVVAYNIGTIYQRGTVNYSQMSIIEALPGSARGHATTYLSIYSPIRHWYEVKFPEGTVFPQVIQNDGSFSRQRLAPMECALSARYEPESSAINDVLIHHWSQRVVKASHNADLGGGIDIQLDWPEGLSINNPATVLRGKVVNNTPYVILQPSLYILNRRYNLGNQLEPGNRYDIPKTFEPINMDELRMLNANVWVNTMSRRRGSRGVQGIPDFDICKIYWSNFSNDPVARGVSLFAGRIDHLFLQPELGRAIDKRKGHSMLAILFDPYRWRSGVFTIPPTAWRIQNLFAEALPNQYLQPINMRRGLMEIPEKKSAEFNLVTNVTIRSAQVRALTILPKQSGIWEFSVGNLRRPRVSILNRRDKIWEEISWDTDQTQRILGGTIRNPYQYVDLRNGLIGIRIENPNSQTVSLLEDALIVNLEVEYRNSLASKAKTDFEETSER